MLHIVFVLGEVHRNLSIQILTFPGIFTDEVLDQYHLELPINPNLIKI